MPNYLLWGADPSAREAKAQELLQDHFIHSIEAGGKILPVKEIRPLLAHWHLHPLQPWKRSGLLVLEAQRMNEEVQNTLLKTLEEPPSFFTFVFTVSHPKLVLPTVTSRCLVTRVEGEYHAQNAQAFEEILRSGPGRRLVIFEEKIGYNREPVRAFLDDLEHHICESKIATSRKRGQHLADRHKTSVADIAGSSAVGPPKASLAGGGPSNLILKEIWETKKILRDDSTNLKIAVDHFLLSW